MTDINPDDYAPTLPLLEPCGCPIRQGHVCAPPWVSAEEWADAQDAAAQIRERQP